MIHLRRKAAFCDADYLPFLNMQISQPLDVSGGPRALVTKCKNVNLTAMPSLPAAALPKTGRLTGVTNGNMSGYGADPYDFQ